MSVRAGTAHPAPGREAAEPRRAARSGPRASPAGLLAAPLWAPGLGALRTDLVRRLQRSHGNQVAQRLLATHTPLGDRPVQRHALSLEELQPSALEQDEEVVPATVQRSLLQRENLGVALQTGSPEYARIQTQAQTVGAAIGPALAELATKGTFERRSSKQFARHIGKAYQRGLLMQPVPLVLVLPAQATALMGAQNAARATGSMRWFRVGHQDDWEIRHQNAGGGFESTTNIAGVTHANRISIRDEVVGDREALKALLVHEGTHFLQHKFNVQQRSAPADQSDKYKLEFRAYWAGSAFNSPRVPGAGAGKTDDQRATEIRQFIVGQNAQDANTIYPMVRDWYWALGPAARTRVDDYRVADDVDLKWWHTNVHILRILHEPFSMTDAQRLTEWNKLKADDQRAVLADQNLRGRLHDVVDDRYPPGRFARAVQYR